MIDVIRELQSYGVDVHVHDPVADPQEARPRVRHRAAGRGTSCRARDAIVARGRAQRVHARPLDDCRRASSSQAALYVDVKCAGRRRRAARAGRHGVEAVMTDAAAASTRSLHGATLREHAATLAGHRQRRVHRLASARGAARPRPERGRPRQLRHRPPANLDEVRRVGRRRARGRAIAFIEGDIRDLDACRARVRGRRRRAAPGGARLGAALDRGSARDARGQRRRLPQHAGRRARRRVKRFVYAASSSTYGDHPGAAEGRGPRSAGRCRRTRSPSSSTSSTPTCSARCYGLQTDRPALLQRVRPRARIPTARTRR